MLEGLIVNMLIEEEEGQTGSGQQARMNRKQYVETATLVQELMREPDKEGA